MTFTRITALAVSSAALLAVAACGQNETKKEPAPVETAPPAMAPATTEPMVGGVAMNPSDNLVACPPWSARFRPPA